MVATTGEQAAGLDNWLAHISRGEWLAFLPARFREPAARALVQVAVAAVVLLTVAPLADRKGPR